MAIESFPRFNRRLRLGLICANLIFLIGSSAYAQDKVTLKQGGRIYSGQITGYAADQITFIPAGKSGSTVLYGEDVLSIEMAPPAAVAAARNGTPAEMIAALTPVLQRFAGLPADWVPIAMVQLAGAYEATRDDAKAASIYSQIDQLYANSRYRMVAVAGDAELKVKAGQPDIAITMLQPLIDQANANLAPSAYDGGLYAEVFLVYGHALEAEKKLPQALEAYLSVKTMFYQNGELAAQADAAATNLLAQNPGVGVD